MEILRDNRKLAKIAKKNRVIFLEECKGISSAQLVNNLDKKEAQLIMRKLKVKFIRQEIR